MLTPLASSLRLVGSSEEAQRIITEDMLDGRMFKTHDHGMRASMRALFAHSYERFRSEDRDPVSFTDFDLRSIVTLNCGALTYELTYSSPASVRMELQGTVPGRPGRDMAAGFHPVPFPLMS